MDQTTELALQIGALATGVAGLTYLSRKLFRLIRYLTRLAKLLDYQLRNNGGSSLLDKVEQNTGAIWHIGERVDSLDDRFEAHLGTQAEAQRELWPAVKAVAEAYPPPDEQK